MWAIHVGLYLYIVKYCTNDSHRYFLWICVSKQANFFSLGYDISVAYVRYISAITYV